MGTLMRQTGAQAGTPFSNLTKDIEAWATKMRELDIKPEMECYSQSMYRDVNNLIKKDLLKPAVLREHGARHAATRAPSRRLPRRLASMIQFLPDGLLLQLLRHVGAAQLPVTTAAMIMGGAVRVGLEDNIYYSKGVLAKSNAHLVERSVRIARELNIEPTTPDEARQILGIVKR